MFIRGKKCLGICCLSNYHQPNLDDLLLQCSLPAKDNLPQLFHSINAGVGWERFLQAAEREGLSELIFYNCREPITRDLPQTVDSRPSTVDCQKAAASMPRRHNLIPPEACRSLKNAYLTTLARNTLFLVKLEQIAHALAGLDFIVLKGAYLARHVYPSPGLRGFSDIDILAKRADLAEVDLRLAKLGYFCGDLFRLGRDASPYPFRGRAKPQAEPSLVAAKGRLKTSSYLNSVMYYPPGNEIAIDVHWHLLNSIVSNYINTTMDVSEIWKAARPFTLTLSFRSVRARSRNESTSAGLELCPEHLLIHLAEHALHHSFERLILLRDIAEVIIRFGDALDWNRLVGECRKFNLARPVFYSLLFISGKTSLPVPEAALDALRPARLGRAEKLFISFTLHGRRCPELCNLAYFDNMSSFGAKIRFGLRLVFPCREVMALTYGKRPHEIGPGVYILRLLHGIRYLTRAVFHFICRLN